jgi:hypothetical protein
MNLWAFGGSVRIIQCGLCIYDEYSCLGIQQVTKLYMPDSTDLVEIVVVQ